MLTTMIILTFISHNLIQFGTSRPRWDDLWIYLWNFNCYIQHISTEMLDQKWWRHTASSVFFPGNGLIVLHPHEWKFNQVIL